MYIIDQHAAHERVLYERTLKRMKEKQFTSQRISPPIVLNLSMQEEQLLSEHMENFTKIGFEIEPFWRGFLCSPCSSRQSVQYCQKKTC